MRVRGPRGSLDLLVARVGAGVADVLRDARAEEHRLLGHDADLPAQPLRVEIAEIATVEQEAAPRRVVEASDQRRDGRLPRAARAHERDDLARWQLERDVVEHGDVVACRVRERHALEAHLATNGLEDLAAGGRHLGLAVHDLVDALGRARRLHELRPEVAQRAERECDEHRVDEESGEIAGCHRSCDDQTAAAPEHERARAVGGEARDAAEARDGEDAPLRDGEALLDRVVVANRLGPLRRERPDGSDAGDALLGDLARRAERLLNFACELANPPAVPHGPDRDRRHDNQHHERELNRRVEQEHDAADGGREASQSHGHVHAHRALQDLRVGAQPVEELARPALVEERDLLTEHAPIERLAERRDDALASGREEHVSERHRDGLHREDDEQRERGVVHDIDEVRRERVVDEDPERLRVREARRAADREKDSPDGEPPPFGPGEPQKPPSNVGRKPPLRALRPRSVHAASLWGLRGPMATCGPHHSPVFGIDVHGSRGGSASPRCKSSTECRSGERTKAIRPSRGGRLTVTPPSISRWHVA